MGRGLGRGTPPLEAPLGPIVEKPVHPKVVIGKAGKRGHEGGISVHGCLKVPYRLLDIVLLEGSRLRGQPLQVMVVGDEVPGRDRFDARLLGGGEADPDRLDSLGRDVRLKAEDVIQRPVVPLRPDVSVVRHADELRGEADPARPAAAPVEADRPLEDPDHVEIRADLLDGLPFARILGRRRPGDDTEFADVGQPARDLLGDPGGEVGILRRTEVVEG
jgi:hypothetical protein